jgi:hypothetical protein
MVTPATTEIPQPPKLSEPANIVDTIESPLKHTFADTMERITGLIEAKKMTRADVQKICETLGAPSLLEIDGNPPLLLNINIILDMYTNRKIGGDYD